jgi:hypothetical protein
MRVTGMISIMHTHNQMIRETQNVKVFGSK